MRLEARTPVKRDGSFPDLRRVFRNVSDALSQEIPASQRFLPQSAFNLIDQMVQRGAATQIPMRFKALAMPPYAGPASANAPRRHPKRAGISDHRWRARSGGAEGDRTPDLIIANDTLSQLSYCPRRPVCCGNRPESQGASPPRKGAGRGVRGASPVPPRIRRHPGRRGLPLRPRAGLSAARRARCGRCCATGAGRSSCRNS